MTLADIWLAAAPSAASPLFSACIPAKSILLPAMAEMSSSSSFPKPLPNPRSSSRNAFPIACATRAKIPHSPSAPASPCIPSMEQPSTNSSLLPTALSTAINPPPKPNSTSLCNFDRQDNGVNFKVSSFFLTAADFSLSQRHRLQSVSCEIRLHQPALPSQFQSLNRRSARPRRISVWNYINRNPDLFLTLIRHPHANFVHKPFLEFCACFQRP